MTRSNPFARLFRKRRVPLAVTPAAEVTIGIDASAPSSAAAIVPTAAYDGPRPTLVVIDELHKFDPAEFSRVVSAMTDEAKRMAAALGAIAGALAEVKVPSFRLEKWQRGMLDDMRRREPGPRGHRYRRAADRSARNSFNQRGRRHGRQSYGRKGNRDPRNQSR